MENSISQSLLYADDFQLKRMQDLDEIGKRIYFFYSIYQEAYISSPSINNFYNIFSSYSLTSLEKPEWA